MARKVNRRKKTSKAAIPTYREDSKTASGPDPKLAIIALLLVVLLIGSDAYDRDFALNLLSKEQDALQEIQAALERITEGTYGICGISGKKIPQARLEAIPFARLTVECQYQWERENPHRKFRSSDAIGFGAATTSSPAVSLDAGA
mgnify:CR=1 FL=1